MSSSSLLAKTSSVPSSPRPSRFISSLTSSKKSFTLLELIVVIVVLAVLAALAIPTFEKLINETKDRSTAATVAAVLREASALAAFRGGTTFTAQDLADAMADLPASGAVGVQASSTQWVLLTDTTGPDSYSDTPGEIHGGVSVSGDTAGAASVSESGRCAFARQIISGQIEQWLSSESIGEDCNAIVAIAGGDPDGPTGGPGPPGGGGTPATTTTTTTTTTSTTTTTTTTPPGYFQPPPGLFPPADDHNATSNGWPNVGDVLILQTGSTHALEFGANDPGSSKANYVLEDVQWSFDAGNTWLDESNWAGALWVFAGTPPSGPFFHSDIQPSVGDTSYWNDAPVTVDNRGGKTAALRAWAAASYFVPPISPGDLRARVQYSYTHSTGVGKGTFVVIRDSTRTGTSDTSKLSSYEDEALYWDTGNYDSGAAGCDTPVVDSGPALPSGTSWALKPPAPSGNVTVTQNSQTSVTVTDNDDSSTNTFTIDSSTGELCWLAHGFSYSVMDTFQGLKAVGIGPSGAWKLFELGLSGSG